MEVGIRVRPRTLVESVAEVLAKESVPASIGVVVADVTAEADPRQRML